ncbi:MAG: YeeE/YedE family protein [Rhodospirillales bacterium]|nr:MAG: YeeE/YedE family protein [Rhodospirillales bacterium]
MGRILAGLAAGLLFGAGLSVSAMINPAKVLNFLDIAGTWDPSLLLVMAGAVAVTFAGYRLVLGRDRPVLETSFAVPTRRDIDPPLIIGAAVFGIGWGLGGYCPGPAIAGLAFGATETLVFAAAMVAGMLSWRIVRQLRARSGPVAAGNA